MLEKYNVEMIGATADAIDKAEDRKLFRDAMSKIGLATPRSHQIKTLIQALEALDDIGLPAIIRPSFTLGGTGGGIAYNKAEFIEIVERGIDASPTSEVLIEESVLGWKEFEMEVVRDKDDNCIIVCSIENIDPMGVHTGDSITVAPALTLTDKEYQSMRDASIAVLREIGVETGGSNVQFAVNPEDGRLVVIEMNPRVSRSSALASKATGFPIAKIAAKLAVGYTLDEIANDITGGATPASFEPTIDYVVTKIPRFAFEKFPGADPVLTTAMKSVGEAMAIGRTFAESLQKALRSPRNRPHRPRRNRDPRPWRRRRQECPPRRARHATPDRLLAVAQAMRLGMSDEDIHSACRIDPWFLAQIRGIVETEAEIKAKGLPTDGRKLRRLKSMGFSDARLAMLAKRHEADVTAARRALGVRPVFKRIDSCAAEFASPTAYMYSTYETPFTAVPPMRSAPVRQKEDRHPRRRPQPHRPGHRVRLLLLPRRLRAEGRRLRNDHGQLQSGDGLDRLRHLRPTLFRTADRRGCSGDHRHRASNGTLHGVIVQFGGQTPLKLAESLEKAGVPILGTSPDAIDLAEDRKRFQHLLDRLKLKQPHNGIAYSAEQARLVAADIGYPFVVRPSYVLGGRAMQILREESQLGDYLLETLPQLVPQT